ncbi:per os infectivity factor 3 [Erinnyis ello granulovirus]|uniref:Per os infectivity factor 3 n=1 Tax=Erinnyis ello granulovirus TaxID=307444 RepID=A0A097DAI5_9BBAC|nr:per os infectivity factor 3 [Erinnyis ello granulovirus]AIS92031.1 per os infectivity factor 3 [Erinnyis ello granulovirus]ARX71370.1 per os infectivity factor 3 [Erinnyis ello granulovirus]ARX71500.1 per os infectivity factor 3 [Erinnyis ello granulovirus]ARX71760.1 per os infectivity factor 3 [Erinnyis ello granulovirus]
MHRVWFVLILCFVFFVSVVTRRWFNQEYETKKNVRIAFEKRNILDCDSVNVPCVADDQCVDNCQGGLMMTCNSSGFCSRELKLTTNNLEDCDANRGMITIINAVGGFVVESACVSLYRDVIDDNGEMREYVCNGGTMDLRLEERPFDVSDCDCPSNHTRFTFTSGAFTRPTPVCVPNNLSSLYQRVYT